LAGDKIVQSNRPGIAVAIVMEKPKNSNEECVGPTSEKAGKVESCEGCPNQKQCSSGEMQIDTGISEIKESMKSIKHKILVLSGKGGVGKSTVSSQIALALAQDENSQVGLLDVDICGPSIPKMMGLEGHQLHQSNFGWTPTYYEENLAVVSVGFMLPNKDDAVIWRGPKKNALIKQFLRDVYWGEYVDYLIVDTPPGTTDEHLSLVTYLKDAGLDGAVIVTTPQDVACIDVRREINFCIKVGIPIIGIVENMSGFVCGKCGTETQIFKSKSGGGEALAKHFNIDFLGKIPLDPEVMKSCETGKSILKEHPESPASKAFSSIIENIKKKIIL
jgi:Mrp family chromosome partitioning ATPase